MWQFVHWYFVAVSFWISPVHGWAGPCCCPASHAFHSSIGCAITRKRMLACESPQYSAHAPRNVPGLSASMVLVLVCPGMTSFLPFSSGTQNEWMTLSDFSDR